MEQILYIVLGILVITVGLWGIIVAVSVVQTLSMKQSKLKRLEDNAPPEDSHSWAVSNGFEFTGNFRFGVVYISGWEHARRPSFFCEYRIQEKSFFDMVTIFANDTGLTTASSKDGQLSPKPPGAYHQTFSGLSLEQLWEKHVEAENDLVEKGGAALPDVMLSFEDEITGSVHKQFEYHKSISLYHFRVPWWYFFRRGRRHNKSIQKQHELGIIRLPNEINNESISGR
ncbi:MAG: hypothetical protein ACYTE8_00045 [Planctomycetota bacterium]|jgi:hypothetical protein